MLVRDLMAKKVFTLRADQKIHLAQDLMQSKFIRHIPIVDDDFHLVGILTHRDLLRASISSLAAVAASERRIFFAQIAIADIMQKDVVTIGPEIDLREAAGLMLERKLGCLPVVDGKKLVGILTEADFMSLAWEATA